MDNIIINVDNMFNRVRSEVMHSLALSRPGDKITIFLSAKLYHLFKGACLEDLQYHLNERNGMMDVTLFGCGVEVFDDRNLSFYVATARKIEF